MDKKQLCEYGCGQEAKHQMKNGKYCCSINHSQCSYIKKKISNSLVGENNPNFGKCLSNETKQKMKKSLKGRLSWNKGKTNIYSEETLKRMSNIKRGKILSEEAKKKLSEANKGRIPWNKGKTNIYSEETLKKMSETGKGRIPWNKGKNHSKETKEKIGNSNRGKTSCRKGKTLSNKQKLKISRTLKMSIRQIKQKYPTFAKEEEMRYNPDKPKEKEIQVHCKNHNCSNSKENNGWFTPTDNQLKSRIYSIERENGNLAHYLYCSNECRENCSLSGKKVSQLIKEDQIRAGIIKEPYYTSEEYNTCREEVLKRANYLCEYCGEKATDMHHIKPQKLEPFFALDPDYCVACCQKCHYEKGHKEECSTGKLSQIICT